MTKQPNPSTIWRRRIRQKRREPSRQMRERLTVMSAQQLVETAKFIGGLLAERQLTGVQS